MNESVPKHSPPGKIRSVPVATLLHFWIPPFGILCGLFAYASSWILLFFAGMSTGTSTGIPVRFQLAWIHTLAIGFFTMIAVSILFHVVPAFTGVPVTHEMAARKTLPFLALGTMGIVGFFLARDSWGWAWGFPVGAGSILVWTGFFFRSLWKRFMERPSSRIQLTFFLLPLSFLAATAGLGFWMGVELIAPAFLGSNLDRIVPVHMAMGLLGWLTLLIWIVSASTHRFILGVTRDYPLGVPLASGGLAIGLLCFAFGHFSRLPFFFWLGWGIIGASFLVYLVWSVLILRMARPLDPILKVWWITAVSGMGLTLGAWMSDLLFGTPISLAVFILMMLWVQPILLGHLHLIGARLLATLISGPENQTPPSLHLHPSYSWAFWGTSVIASLLGLWGLSMAEGRLLALSGGLGVLSSGILLGHIVSMVRTFKKSSKSGPSASSMIRFPR